MRRAIQLLAMAFLFSTTAVAQPLCLDSRNVTDSKALDSHSVTFRMIDGNRWRGALSTECPGLNFNGFVLYPANSDRICEGVQLIRVLQNKQVCRIAKLEQMPLETH